MIARVLGKIGIPILVKYISKSLSLLPNDIAKKASSALFEVDEAISKKEISLQEVREVNRHLEAQKQIEMQMDNQTLSLIHETMRQEMNAQDKFVRFWRPAFGYSVALSWLVMMFTICYAVVFYQQNAADMILALVETTSLWAIALGVLGVSVVKTSKEENKEANNGLTTKMINKII